MKYYALYRDDFASITPVNDSSCYKNLDDALSASGDCPDKLLSINEQSLHEISNKFNKYSLEEGGIQDIISLNPKVIIPVYILKKNLHENYSSDYQTVHDFLISIRDDVYYKSFRVVGLMNEDIIKFMNDPNEVMFINKRYMDYCVCKFSDLFDQYYNKKCLSL